MRAYNFMTLLICVGIGITLMFAIGIFNIYGADDSGDIDEGDIGYQFDLDALVIEIAAIAAIGAVGGFFAANAIDVVTRGGGQSGVSASVVTFGALYGAVWFAIEGLLFRIMNDFAGMEIILTIITLFGTIIFIIALVQMSSGGMKSHV